MKTNFSQDVTFQLYKTHFDYAQDSLVLDYVATPPEGDKEQFSCKVTSDASIYFILKNPDGSESISLKAFTNIDDTWKSPLMEAGQHYELKAFCTDNVSTSVTVHVDSEYQHI